MKKLASQFASFLSYHNAVPIAFGLLFLGGASAFAATATGVIDVPAVFAPKEVDVSTLLSADIDAFDFRPTVLGIAETDMAYTVSYSLQTLAPDGGAWVSYEKTGEFTVAKDALDETGLQGYVVQKLKDTENGERSYLARAQATEKELAAKQNVQPASAFAALVGLALDQIHVPVVEKPIPEPQPQTTEPVVPTPAAQQDAAASNLAEQLATTTPKTATSTPDATEAHAATSTPPTSDTASSTATSTDNGVEIPAPTEATATTTNATADSDMGTEQAEDSDNNESATAEPTSDAGSEPSEQTETASPALAD